MKEKEKLLLVCPGRGSYTKETLGYFHRHHRNNSFLWNLAQEFDERRKTLGQIPLLELDAATRFDPITHTLGENASALIYLCAFADFYQLWNRDRHDIVAVVGNSMGHYISCVCAQAIDPLAGFDLINTMGSMMSSSQFGIIGGQVIDSLVDEGWRPSPEAITLSNQLVTQIPDLYVSIELGGYRVYGGTNEALKELLKRLPARKPYPFKLMNHGAFHTPLLIPISQKAKEIFPPTFFHPPKIPLIDGSGRIYNPWNTNPSALYHYTFTEQVLETYNFTKSVEVALKEFAPSKIVLLGPGNTLGGALGQILIKNSWGEFTDKNQFSKLQEEKPFLYSLGLENQRELLLYDKHE